MDASSRRIALTSAASAVIFSLAFGGSTASTRPSTASGFMGSVTVGVSEGLVMSRQYEMTRWGSALFVPEQLWRPTRFGDAQ